jgi:hypothetical protein
MKLQRSTWILLLVAIALAGGVALYESQQANQPPTAESGSGERLFDFTEADVVKLIVKRPDTILSFEKSGDSWRMTAPQQAPAEPAAIAFLLNIVTQDPTLQTLEAALEQLSEFGLDQPQETIALTLADGATHTLAIGKPDFSGDSRYARLLDAADAAAEAPVKVYVVSGGITNAIQRPEPEWLAAADSAPPSAQPAQAEPPAAAPAPAN